VAKKRTRRRSSDGVQAQERKRDRLDSRRQARAEALAAQARAERRRRLLRAAIVGLLGAAVGWFLIVQLAPEPTPDAIDGHRVIDFDETGVNEHVSGPVDYESTPPTHGPHASGPAACGVHSEPIPDENMVHSLEHGAVGLLYEPSLAIEEVRTLEDIAGSYSGRVFSAPYSDMPTPIAVTSWGEMMRLDSLDAGAVREYIETFRGRGPEDVGCPSTSDSPFSPA
jgi:Protein of unknown function (DUF3105)